MRVDTESVAGAAQTSSAVRWLVGGGVFVAAFLLFLVEPIVAKELLPVLGGSAAVWITCLVFFQTALLAGYAYAHWMADRGGRGALVGHLALLTVGALSALAWGFHAYSTTRAGTAHPFLLLFQALLLTIGLPFVALASTSPLFQAWIARLKPGAIPYRLFALSNLASLLALALYPTLIEPYLRLRTQRIAWSIGFVCFVALSCWLTRTLGKSGPAAAANDPATEATRANEADSADAPRASGRDRALWFLLPMVAAMQLSAVTSYITANIAAIPLLWILPLAAYLISLTIAFQAGGRVPRGLLLRLLAVMLASLAYLLAKIDVTLPTWIAIGFFLMEVFVACLFCHVEAYAIRPQRTSELTSFYLLFAAGGAAGSFLIGVVAPLVMSANYDVPITFFATALVAVAVTWDQGWSQRLLWSVGSALLVYVIVLLHAAYQQKTLVMVRNFYGSLRVKQSELPGLYPIRTLTHGTIQHGTQIFTPELMHTPTTYYAEDSGVGLALRYCCEGRARSVGVIGLGAGTLAAYGKPGDRMRFYELNPAVLPIAQHLFTYLRDSPAQISFAEGDARASLVQEAPQGFDVLVVDAFSGDAIPLHLLTREALELYKRHLAPGGILAFHVSNQHVALEPEIALLAAAAGMQARTVQTEPLPSRGEYRASWVLVTNNQSFLSNPAVADVILLPDQKPGLRLWSDDYSSLLPLLR
jgi:hypothetical protein